MTLGLRSPLHSLVVIWPILVIENEAYQSNGNAGAETVSSVAIKHHIIKQPTILAIAQRELKSM